MQSAQTVPVLWGPLLAVCEPSAQQHLKQPLAVWAFLPAPEPSLHSKPVQSRAEEILGHLATGKWFGDLMLRAKTSFPSHPVILGHWVWGRGAFRRSCSVFIWGVQIVAVTAVHRNKTKLIWVSLLQYLEDLNWIFDIVHINCVANNLLSVCL